MRSAPRELGQASSQYELVARLTEGGMAEIFLARSRGMANFGRYVVLKRILPERGADERWIEMFLDEARLVAQLQHPNIAHVFDLGRLGDGYFFTMEYVHGANMREVLVRCSQRGRRLPLAAAVGVGVGAASGLSHAHSRKDAEGRPLGIVHRDVSPSNLMLSFEGVVKLVDFGVAKALSHSSVTQSGTVKGKVSYLSPEQCRGHAVDHRSDLFALGIVLYEMTTTKRLYRRSSDFETMSAIVNEVPEPPSRYNPEISPDLDAIIMRALEKAPGRRQQSAGELLEELEDVAHREGMAISNTQLRRQMRELFGEQPEPWHVLENGLLPAKREVEVTYTADGLLEEELESVEVPVVQGLDYGTSGPVAVANATSPLRRGPEAAGHAPRVTQAFPVEAAADQVPLLDSLRAAMQVASELDAERSSSAQAPALLEEQAAATLPAPGNATLTDPSGPPPNALASSTPAPSAIGSGPVPRAVSEPAVGSGRAARATSQPLDGAAAPRLSEAITIPTADADRPVERVPQAPLPVALAAGQLSVGAPGPASPGIWDRPMASSAPPAQEPARLPPGYAPKATLLGSAPPPSARTAPRPEAADARAADSARLHGVAVDHGRSPAPSYGAPSPAASYPPAYHDAPVYPRAPAEVTGARRQLPEPAARRRWPVVAALAALLIAGVALGALLARGEDPARSEAISDAIVDAAAQPLPPPETAATTATAPPTVGEPASAVEDAVAPAVAAPPADAATTAAPAPAAPATEAAAAPPASAAGRAAADAPPADRAAPAGSGEPRTATPTLADCRALASDADEQRRTACVMLLCEHKQLDAARRAARPLSAAAQREATKACPALVAPARPPARPKQPEPAPVPDKPACTGPLCRR